MRYVRVPGAALLPYQERDDELQAGLSGLLQRPDQSRQARRRPTPQEQVQERDFHLRRLSYQARDLPETRHPPHRRKGVLHVADPVDESALERLSTGVDPPIG